MRFLNRYGKEVASPAPQQITGIRGELAAIIRDQATANSKNLPTYLSKAAPMLIDEALKMMLSMPEEELAIFCNQLQEKLRDILRKNGYSSIIRQDISAGAD